MRTDRSGHLGKYRSWDKTQLINKVRELELDILSLLKDLKTEKKIFKWGIKMKLTEVMDSTVPTKMVSAKIPVSDYEFIKDKGINLTKLIRVAIQELRELEEDGVKR